MVSMKGGSGVSELPRVTFRRLSLSFLFFPGGFPLHVGVLVLHVLCVVRRHRAHLLLLLLPDVLAHVLPAAGGQEFGGRSRHDAPCWGPVPQPQNRWAFNPSARVSHVERLLPHALSQVILLPTRSPSPRSAASSSSSSAAWATSGSWARTTSRLAHQLLL